MGFHTQESVHGGTILINTELYLSKLSLKTSFTEVLVELG